MAGFEFDLSAKQTRERARENAEATDDDESVDWAR